MRDVLSNFVNYNGKSSLDYDIIIARNPSLTRANRKFDAVSVPGRNGNLYFMQDAWENYTQTYSLFVGDGSDNSVNDAAQKIAEWLIDTTSTTTVDDYINLTVNGYHQLIDSYETDVIRLATLTNGFNMNNLRGLFGKTDIQFNCRPERFTADAFTAVVITASTSQITNPASQYSKPFIKVYGTGAGAITVNGYAVTISAIDTYMHIDCDMQNCFKTLTQNKNYAVAVANGFPQLKPGRNTISFSGGVTKLEITPRWWNL